MPQRKPDPEEVVRSYANRILQKIEQLRPGQPTEADLQRNVDTLLEKFCRELGLELRPRGGYRLSTGRADAVFNRFVIEYKRPGMLSDSLSHGKTAAAIEQVKKYIQALAKEQSQQINRIAGVAFDGCYIVFVRYRDGDFSVEGPTSVSQASLERLLRWLSSLSGIALTAENLKRDFSIEQPRTQTILRALNEGLDAALDQKGSAMVHNLFKQWKLFFSESIDYSKAFGGKKLKPLQQCASEAGLTVVTVDEAERFFFCLHTYFALLVKMIAWLALSRLLGGKLGALRFEKLVSADSDTLRDHLKDMESGGIFRCFGITNLLEGDFFAWYLYAWNKKIEKGILKLLQRMDEYDPATLAIVPEETRDLFKQLYHYLLPREIRHNLGEYYTPDWLAQHLLQQVDNWFFTADPREKESELRRKLLNLRWLDPACGSGTFLVLIIARMRELGRELMVNEADLLDTILHNVVGFDLNPLAVITARVNYLLAIADLLPHCKGDIILPVYLADSVRTPAMGEGLYEAGNYVFPTEIESFLVPDDLCTKDRFDRFCDLLEESIEDGIQPKPFLKRIETELKLVPPAWTEKDAQTARKLYERMLELHRNGVNGLWARLLKNNFAPLTVGEFDYIVGNPPWINWEHLPKDYRDSNRDLWLRYQLAGTFASGRPKRGRANRERPKLGTVKVDISALMTYVVADKLLKPDGRLGFLITQSVFKTAAGAGFRHFRIPQGNGEIPLRVVHVDDMVSLQPFEGASNRTAAFVLEKGKPTTYPVPYTLWRKMKGARFTYDSTLEEVLAATKQLDFVAEPVAPQEPTSLWLTAPPNALKPVRKMLRSSDYEAHAGVCTWLNSVYWVDIVKKRGDGLVVVRNITEGAKTQVKKVTKPIEAGLLYPLLRGRDVQRWRAEPSAWMIVPQDPNDPTHAYPKKRLQSDYPKTYGYLKGFEKELRNRSGFKEILSKRENEFYGVMDIGSYTFAHWKVVWTRLATIKAAVIGLHNEKPVVPQETIALVACQSEQEAHYIAALVNSSPFQFAAISYSQEGGKSMGSMHILEHIRLPRFDPSDPVHRRLAELSQQAHEAAKSGDEEALRQIEAQIDQEAANLWSLTDKELREIQQGLKELSQ